MAETDQIINGNIERRPQQEHIVGNDHIITYVLTEHEFETLGEYKDTSVFVSAATMCMGLFVPSLVNLFDTSNGINGLWIANLVIMVVGFLGAGCSIAICVWRMRKYGPVYDRLKEEAKVIQQLSQESHQNVEDNQQP